MHVQYATPSEYLAALQASQANGEVGAWPVKNASSGSFFPYVPNANSGAAYSFAYTIVCFVLVALFMWIMRTRLKDFARVQ